MTPRRPQQYPPQITMENVPTNQFSTALQLVLNGIQESLQHVSDAIYGNGSEGLKTITAGNTQSIEELKGLIRELTTNVSVLTKAISDLTISVDRHHRTLHFDDLIKKPSFWIISFFGLGAMHAIYTYFPGIFIVAINGIFHTSFPIPSI